MKTFKQNEVNFYINGDRFYLSFWCDKINLIDRNTKKVVKEFCKAPKTNKYWDEETKYKAQKECIKLNN